MIPHTPDLHVKGHVGPFILYPSAAFALVVAASPGKRELPRWRNTIPTITHENICDATFDVFGVMYDALASHGRCILLFADWQIFSAYLHVLTREIGQ